MPTRDIVVIGASAGGVEALTALAARLPADLPASLFVVLHLSPTHKSVLPQILAKAGPLPVEHAEDGAPFLHGHIYVAPPDRHLVLGPNAMRLLRGPRENGNRPAIDPLFRTAARYFGPRVIGVVLSGSLDDGSAGLLAVKQAGGASLVQDPLDALCPDMPRAAMALARPRHVAPIPDLAALLVRLARGRAPKGSPRAKVALLRETAIVLAGEEQAIAPPGAPSRYSCPACGGVLNEVEQSGPARFRCQVGHAYSSETLVADQQTALEGALWSALRALDEKASLSRRLARRARALKQERSARRFDERAETAEQQGALVRQALNVHQQRLSDEGEEPAPRSKEA